MLESNRERHFCFAKGSYLEKTGDPPAQLGRHQQFDSNGNLTVTPKREPPSTTQRRNHEIDRKFKPHALGV
jgi:hypothetical protein